MSTSTGRDGRRRRAVYVGALTCLTAAVATVRAGDPGPTRSVDPDAYRQATDALAKKQAARAAGASPVRPGGPPPCPDDVAPQVWQALRTYLARERLYVDRAVLPVRSDRVPIAAVRGVGVSHGKEGRGGWFARVCCRVVLHAGKRGRRPRQRKLLSHGPQRGCLDKGCGQLAALRRGCGGDACGAGMYGVAAGRPGARGRPALGSLTGCRGQAQQPRGCPSLQPLRDAWQGQPGSPW